MSPAAISFLWIDRQYLKISSRNDPKRLSTPPDGFWGVDGFLTPVATFFFAGLLAFAGFPAPLASPDRSTGLWEPFFGVGDFGVGGDVDRAGFLPGVDELEGGADFEPALRSEPGTKFRWYLLLFLLGDGKGDCLSFV